MILWVSEAEGEKEKEEGGRKGKVISSRPCPSPPPQLPAPAQGWW